MIEDKLLKIDTELCGVNADKLEHSIENSKSQIVGHALKSICKKHRNALYGKLHLNAVSGEVFIAGKVSLHKYHSYVKG